MQISNTPKKFAPLFGEAIFEIETNGIQSADIEIIDSLNSIIGIKRVSNNLVHTINIMPYMLGNLNIEPVNYESPNLTMDTQRIVPIKIKVSSGDQEVQSSVVPLLYASESQSNSPILNSAPTPKLIYANSLEQIDVLVDNQTISIDVEFISNGTVSGQQHWGTLENQTGIVTIAVNAAKILEATESDSKIIPFRFKISIDDKPIYIDYLLMADCNEKLSVKWINRYGGIDSHPFETILTESMEVSRNAMAECTSVKKSFTISSETEDSVIAHWLCEVMQARKVWIAINKKIFEVDIQNKSINIMHDQLQKVSFIVAAKNNLNLNY